MNKKRKLVIPVLLGMICIGLTPVSGYAAADESQSTELTLEVPEKPEPKLEVPADKETLKEVTLPEEWTWKEDTTPVQPGRTITVTAVHKDGYEVGVEVTGALAILAAKTTKEYTIGSKSSVTTHCNGVLDALTGVEMDKKTVDPVNYKKKEGSTIITFQNSYLDKLSVGDHTVTLNYEAGSIDSTLKIKKAAATSKPTGTNTSVKGTKTGDEADVAGMAALAVLSLGMCILLVKRKNRI